MIYQIQQEKYDISTDKYNHEFIAQIEIKETDNNPVEKLNDWIMKEKEKIILKSGYQLMLCTEESDKFLKIDI